MSASVSPTAAIAHFQNSESRFLGMCLNDTSKFDLGCSNAHKLEFYKVIDLDKIYSGTYRDKNLVRLLGANFIPLIIYSKGLC